MLACAALSPPMVEQSSSPHHLNNMISFFPYLAQYGYSDYGYAAPGGEALLGSGATMIGLMLILGAGLIGFIVQQNMRASFAKYSAERAPLTGAEAAELMLREHGLGDVRVISTPGRLTDHYNPLDRTVNLSEDVYHNATIAAMAVAAHECGHAVQHAQAYPWLSLRSSLVPMVNIGSRLGQFVLMLGLVLAAMGSGTTVAWVGLALFATTTLFAFVTLPVEFDASRRALAWLESRSEGRALRGEAATALRWAAMTYVAAALSSLAMLAYYALLLLSRSGRRD